MRYCQRSGCIGVRSDTFGPINTFAPIVTGQQYQKQNGTLTDKEYARPITIGDNCWIAGNVTICGGVTIGEGCVIGAGSVVTRDIPANSLAVGVPCRVIREITEEDALENHPELF